MSYNPHASDQASSYYGAGAPPQGYEGQSGQGDRGLGTALVLGIAGTTLLNQHNAQQGQQHGAPPQQGGYPAQAGAYAQHSATQGGGIPHRALLIGCNYQHVQQGQGGPLRGCHQDMQDLAQLLTETYRFDPRCILKLQDDGVSTPPTISHVRHQMRQLVDFANSVPGESVVVFAFSGRGKQVKDLSGDEADGLDEAIVILDDRGQPTTLVDDEIHDALAVALPARAKLVAIVDASASGTIVDLPYAYGRRHGNYENLDSARLVKKKKRKSWFSSSKPVAPTPKTPQANIVLWAGCGEGKHAYEGKATGGVTRGHFATAFIQTLRQPNQTYEAIMSAIDASLKKHGTDQKAQIATAHPVELRTQFTLLDIKAPFAQHYGHARDTQASGYPAPQSAYSAPQSSYPPAQSSYPPAQSGYPPTQSSYPPPQGAYPPPASSAYPPQQQGAYPPLQSPGGFAPPGPSVPYPPHQQGAYPPIGGGPGGFAPPGQAPYPPPPGQQQQQGGGGPGGFVMPGAGSTSWQGY